MATARQSSCNLQAPNYYTASQLRWHKWLIKCPHGNLILNFRLLGRYSGADFCLVPGQSIPRPESSSWPWGSCCHAKDILDLPQVNLDCIVPILILSEPKPFPPLASLWFSWMGLDNWMPGWELCFSGSGLRKAELSPCIPMLGCHLQLITGGWAPLTHKKIPPQRWEGA